MKTINDSPEFQYICEARQPGKKSHEFPCVDGEAARAMCDAMGWELIRVYQPGGDSDRPKSAPVKGDHPLTSAQIKALVTEAGRTHRALRNMGVVTDGFDDWRHDQVWACVKREGLTHCLNSHYAKLLNHFLTLRGAPPRRRGAAAKRQSREGGDTLERREQIIHAIAHELGHHARRVDKPQGDAETAAANHAISKGGIIGEDYLMKLARAKNPGATLHDVGCLIKLPASRLEQLLWTMRNRIAAREGRGETKNRNKNQ